MEMSPVDTVKLGFYNAIRKTPNSLLFGVNMLLTYGLLYAKINDIKTYFNDNRMRNLEEKRKMIFRLACSSNIL